MNWINNLASLFKLIFFLTKVGPITALNKVPGNDPIEKHAKKVIKNFNVVTPG